MKIIDYIKILKNKNLNELLKILDNFSILKIKGKDINKSVLISVLLHGDESCGLYTLKEFLKSKIIPEVNVYFLVGNVEAANLKNIFSNRYVPKGENFNRIWTKTPKTTNENKALEVFEYFKDKNLIGVLDIHSFNSKYLTQHCFINKLDPKTKALSKTICENIFHIGVSENMLIQLFSEIAPSILIECGYSNSKESCNFALNSFCIFLRNIEKNNSLEDIQIYQNEVNIKLKENADFNELDFNKKLKDMNLNKILKDILFFKGNINSLKIQKDNRLINPQKYFYEKDGSIFLKKNRIMTLFILNEFILKESGFYIYDC